MDDSIELGSLPESIDKDSITKTQLEFIRDSFSSQLPVILVGGYADEALLTGKITREHHDVDLVTKRQHVEVVKIGYQNLGYHVEEVVETGAEKPYKLLLKKGNSEIDVAILNLDAETNQPYIDIKGEGERFRVLFTADTYDFPQQSLEGIEVRTLSPLALIQMKNTASIIGRFEPRKKDKISQRDLGDKYFPGEDLTSKKFKPQIIKLS